MGRFSTVLGLFLVLGFSSVQAGWFRSEPFPHQRYPGEVRPDAEVARVQLSGRIGKVIVRVDRAGDDRLWNDGRGWYDIWHADLLPGTYKLRFFANHIVTNRKGVEKSQTPLVSRVEIEAVLEAGHTYRIRPAPDVEGFHALRKDTAYIVEDLGIGFPKDCFYAPNLLTDADPDTGFAKACSPP